MAINYFPQIASLIRASASAAGLSLADAAREWLADNSVHAQGAWWAAHANDPYYTAEQMYKTAIGDPAAETAELLCGNMVNMFQGVAYYLGLQSRVVWLYSDELGFFQGHTYNEVYDASLGRWVIQDADYNVCYVDRATGQKIGVAEMMAADDIDHFVPINADVKGWADTGAEPLRLANFYAAQVVQSQNILYVSPDSVSAGLLTDISATLSGVYTYSTVYEAGNPAMNHLTDDDAALVGGRWTLTGASGADYLSYDGQWQTPGFATLAGLAGNDVLALRWCAGQLYGNAGNDTLIGSQFVDILSGSVGDDYMSGGGGADQYIMQSVDGLNDVIDSFGWGADKLVFINCSGTGGAGGTTTSLTQREFSFRVSQTIESDGVYVQYDIDGDGRKDGGVLLEGREIPITTADASFVFQASPMSGVITTAVAAPSGTGYAEMITGTSAADKIIYTGNLGAQIAGSATGTGSGNDFLQSHSDANCALYGHDGNDVIFGGLGHDYIVGGAGNDYLGGRAGYDCFVFQQGCGNDTIEDFDAYDSLAVYGGGSFAQSIKQSWAGDSLVIGVDFTRDGVSDATLTLLNQTALTTASDWVFV